MGRLLILAIILFHSFYLAVSFESDLLLSRRQANNTSSIASLNATMAQLGIPQACYGNCSLFVNQTANCPDATCECNDEYEKAVYDCYLCTSVTLDSGFDAAQEKINRVYEACTRLGYNLPLLLYPGEVGVNAASFTSMSSTSTFSPMTQSIGSHPQVTQGTAEDSTGNDIDPQQTSNGGTNLAPGIGFSLGLMLVRVMVSERW